MNIHLPRRRLLAMHILAGTALSLAFASLASAQYTVGNPRPLDRNPTIGLNGRNPTTAPDIGALTRYNNAVVTGNAGYGRAFRGYVGYLAPDDFRASLGTNDLFNFRRDSSSGTQVNQGIRGTDSLRYQFMLSTGQTPPSLLRGPTSASGAVPLYSRDASPASNTGAALRSTSDYLGVRSLQPSVVGYRTDEQGQAYALTASPLLGVTMIPVELPGAAPKARDTSLVPSGQVPPGGARPTFPDGKIPTPGQAVENAPPSRRGDSRVLSGLEATRPGLMTPLAAQQMVDTANAASRVNTRISAPTSVMEPFKRSLPADKTVVPPTDPAADPNTTVRPKPVWEQELDQLRERMRQQEAEKKKDRGQKIPAPGDATNSTDDPIANPLIPGRPASGENSKPGKPKPPKAAGSDQMSLDEIRDMTRSDLDKLDRDVLRALISTRPLLDHLVPAIPTDNYAYDYHMQAGESSLANRRFFDAEDRFLRALAAVPKDPLASVGRAHAQLGAGLYLSSASNLHSLFAEHPEMIGVRYDRSLLFSADRSDEIARQMRADIKNADTLLGRDAALLLAYLGYQVGDRAMLEEGIKAFAGSTRADNDADRADLTLLALMHRIWVDGEKGEVDSSPVSPAPAKPEPAVPPAPQPADKSR
ncbi:MAG: hypothetical protein H7210_01455 [Pyrinomonadaceae bacterium]|nr:hypothetical protein [Phycisphaerales bacterium]